MILHDTLPPDMYRARNLPGAQPVTADWFRCDEAYAGQMALRRQLLTERRADVCAYAPGGLTAAQEVYDEICGLLPGHGFEINGSVARCPDGVSVALDRNDPLGTLGALVQCDLCVMEKEEGAGEHHLAAAVLCFPAAWTLTEKIGKKMVRIHKPVALYDANIARRVQRLFDGVQVGRPLWRYNQHFQDDAALYTPVAEAEKLGRVRTGPQRDGHFFRSERQTVLRLPKTRAVLFAIHTYMLAREDVVGLVT